MSPETLSISPEQLAPMAGRVVFRQTDPGGPDKGLLLRTMPDCSVSSLAGEFSLAASGSTVDINTAAESGRISFSGLFIADGAGTLSLPSGPNEPALTTGTYDVREDCFVELALTLTPENDRRGTVHFRGILVEKGVRFWVFRVTRGRPSLSS